MRRSWDVSHEIIFRLSISGMMKYFHVKAVWWESRTRVSLYLFVFTTNVWRRVVSAFYETLMRSVCLVSWDKPPWTLTWDISTSKCLLHGSICLVVRGCSHSWDSPWDSHEPSHEENRLRRLLFSFVIPGPCRTPKLIPPLTLRDPLSSRQRRPPPRQNTLGKYGTGMYVCMYDTLHFGGGGVYILLLLDRREVEMSTNIFFVRLPWGDFPTRGVSWEIKTWDASWDIVMTLFGHIETN